MKIEKIKPIPKYILKLIVREEKIDRIYRPNIRFYSYLSKNDGELVKIIVACKNKINSARWRCKQVIVHGIHSDKCFLKDIYQNYMHHYCVGWYAEGLQKQPKWYEDNEWGWQYDRYFNIPCTVLNPEYALKFSEYKYSAINLYTFCDTFNYLRTYEQYPQAEMLVKFGLSEFATSKQILNKVEKDKAFCKWLIKHKEEIAKYDYYVGTLLIAYKTGRDIAQIQRFEKEKKKYFHTDNYKDIKRIFTTNKELSTLLDYIYKQDISMASYSDYLKACTYLGLDMSLPKNRLPHNFRKWHDIRIDEYHTAKAVKDAEERKELYSKFASIAEKYMALQRNKEDTFIVVIARSPHDLMREGDILNHCVGRMNYDQRFIREESLIFFVREKQNPDIPFVTVEYSLKDHKILQCSSEHNHRPADDVLEFVNKKWLPYANRQVRKIEKQAA